MARVNLAMTYARTGDTKSAGSQLAEVLKQKPGNAAANFNMGLLAAEQKDTASAERHLRTALKADPRMDQTAYNLGLLVYKSDPKEGAKALKRALELNPNPRYAFTLGYVLRVQNKPDQAVSVLQTAAKRWPWYGQTYLLLAEIQVSQGQSQAAIETLRKGIRVPNLNQAECRHLKRALDGLL